MAILGMLFQAWYNAFSAPDTGKFDFRKFWEENNDAFMLAIIGVCLIVSIIGLVPEAGEIITTLTGFTINIPITNGGAIFLGGFVYEQIRKKRKAKKE